MHEMIVKLTWDADNLGPMWMNPDNLALLLYSKNGDATRPDLLRMDVIDHTEWRGKEPEIKVTGDPVSVAHEVVKLIKQELRKVL